MTAGRVSAGAGDGGAKRDRTADLLRARQALSQLSYGPEDNLCETRRFDATHSLLCEYRSNAVSRKFGGSGQI